MEQLIKKYNIVLLTEKIQDLDEDNLIHESYGYDINSESLVLEQAISNLKAAIRDLRVELGPISNIDFIGTKEIDKAFDKMYGNTWIEKDLDGLFYSLDSFEQ